MQTRYSKDEGSVTVTDQLVAPPKQMNQAISNAEIDRRRAEAIPKGWGSVFPIYVERARNSELWDVEGRRYIDFASGIAVVNVGHCHPKVTKAVQEQAEKFLHTAFMVAPYENAVRLAERLNDLTPGDYAKKTVFFSGGVEAVENAVKISRAATKRPGIITLGGGFHGRTYMGLALTGKIAPYKAGFGPFPANIYHVPAPIPLHGVSTKDSLDAIHALFRADIEPEQVAAIILEPVLGEGGFYVIPPEMMRGVREICDRYGILFVADEIQTGFGRTGKWFAMNHYNVIPDLITMAKSLGGGMPLSAVTGRKEIMDVCLPGSLGSTYGGNPLSIAAAHAVLDVMVEEKLNDRSKKLGDRLVAHLNGLRAKTSAISDVRGLGSMVAVEFAKPDGSPDPEMTVNVRKRAQADGLLFISCGIYGNAIRFLYPLTIEDAVFEEALGILSKAILNT
jgi:4-aminobutyrate aminotransferase